MERNQVIAVHNVTTTYHVPLLLEKQNLLQTLGDLLDLKAVQQPATRIEQGAAMWKNWVELAHSQERLDDTVSIAIVGKYTSHHDAYISLNKSFEHAAMYCRKKLQIVWVDSGDLEDETQTKNPAQYHKAWQAVCSANGVCVPGGFGTRGTAGMIKAITWARTNKTPYLGICLGMQLAVIEYARSVLGVKDAGSEELHPEVETHAIVYMPEVDKTKLGGTMRLGKHPCIFQEGTEWSKLRALYGSATQIEERHRHRYEVNPDMVEKLEKAGLTFVAKDIKGERMEIIEVRDHPWFVAAQYHPEYLSRVLAPSKVSLSSSSSSFLFHSTFFFLLFRPYANRVRLDCVGILRRCRWLFGESNYCIAKRLAEFRLRK